MSPSNAVGLDGRCGALKKNGEECKLRAGHGTEHVGRGTCKLHGGNSPSHVAKAQREEAVEAVERYGLAVEVDPNDALLEELHRCAGHVSWLNVKVSELQGDQGAGLIQSSPAGLRPSVWVELYHLERKRLTDVAKTCLDAGIDERRVVVAEKTGQLFAQAIEGILSDLGVADDPRVGDVVRKRLTLIQGGRAA